MSPADDDVAYADPEAITSGAINLLTKAGTAAAAGNQAKAERLVRRAAELPYIEQENMWPGIMGAQALLYGAVMEAGEQAWDEGDEQWDAFLSRLRAAEVDVAGDPLSLRVLESVFAWVAQEFHEMGMGEDLRRLAADADLNPRVDVPGEARVPFILGLVRLCITVNPDQFTSPR